MILNRDAFWSKYKSWVEKHFAQLLELDTGNRKWVGFLIAGRCPPDAPEGLNRMAIRSDDDWDHPRTLERHVVVNRYGWYYTERPVPEDYVRIKDWNFIS